MNKILTEEQVSSLLKCLEKAFVYWKDKNKIKDNQIDGHKFSVNQSKLHSEVYSWFIIKKDDV